MLHTTYGVHQGLNGRPLRKDIHKFPVGSRLAGERDESCIMSLVRNKTRSISFLSSVPQRFDIYSEDSIDLEESFATAIMTIQSCHGKLLTDASSCDNSRAGVHVVLGGQFSPAHVYELALAILVHVDWQLQASLWRAHARSV